MSINGVHDPSVLIKETFYPEAAKLQEAETQYQEYLETMRRAGMGDVPNKLQKKASPSPKSSIAIEIANIRSKIQDFNLRVDGIEPPQSSLTLDQSSTILETLNKITTEYGQLKSMVTNQADEIQKILKRLDKLELEESINVELKTTSFSLHSKKSENIVKNGTTEDDDDIDLFGSDEETEEERKVKEERLKAYENKKAKKAQVIAKSSVVLDVKPWSDETDLKEMETQVRKIESAGLKWGASKQVPLAYGIKKLQIIAIVEDDNCSIDWLQEQIENIEDLVQSVDIAAFNKL
jgi:elongation factor 1-delta